MHDGICLTIACRCCLHLLCGLRSIQLGPKPGKDAPHDARCKLDDLWGRLLLTERRVGQDLEKQAQDGHLQPVRMHVK